MREEKLVIGDRIQGRARTVTDAEVALLPAMMGAMNPLFHDEVAAAKGPAGRRILFGPALLGIAIAGTEFLLQDLVIGLVGLTDMRFSAPVGVGDTITPFMTVADRIEKPDKAGDILLTYDEVENQIGSIVLSFKRAIMVRRTVRR